MKNDTFISVGTVINKCMLVQISRGVGMMIHLPTGNRLEDKVVDVGLNRETGQFGATYGAIVDIYTGATIGDEINALAITNAGTIPKVLEKQKSDIVDFVRYIRPRNEDFEIDNNYGITFLFSLDYKTRMVEFQYSICRGDNFNKKTGVAIAKTRMPFIIEMPEDGIPEDGVVAYVVEKINTGHFPTITKQERDYIISMFVCS